MLLKKLFLPRDKAPPQKKMNTLPKTKCATKFRQTYGYAFLWQKRLLKEYIYLTTKTKKTTISRFFVTNQNIVRQNKPLRTNI